MNYFKNNEFVYEFVAASDFFKDMDEGDDSIVNPGMNQKQMAVPAKNRLESDRDVKKSSQLQPQYQIEMISTKTIIENERKKQNKKVVTNKSVPRKYNQFAPYRPAQKKSQYPVVEKVSHEKKKIIFQRVVISKENSGSQ